MQVLDYHEAIFASDLTSPAKITALAIGSYYNWSEEAMCWPSNKTIAKATGLGVSTIVKAKKELVLAGYLEVWRRIDNSNMYKPLIPHSIPRVSYSRESAILEKRVYSETQTNNEVNNEYNNEINNEKNKENVSNETLILSTEEEAEESSAINNISFDDMFYKFERITDEERHPRPAPAGSGYKERRRSNSPVGRYDIDDAELSAFNQELARAREESW